MNQVDFSFTGGFPLDQEVLAFMQNSYGNILTAMLADVPANTLIALSGASRSWNSSTGYNITDGWLYYNKKLYKLTSGSYGMGMPINHTECISLSSTPANVIFQDNSVKNVYHTYTASTALAIPDATNIPLNTMQTWQGYQAGTLQGAFTTINFNNSSLGGAILNGSINWRKNLWTRQLEVYGNIVVTNAQNISLSNPYVQVATIPGVYLPDTMAFAGFQRYHNGPVITDQAGSSFMQINGDMYTMPYSDTVTINLGLRRPESAGAYSVYINTTAPLA